MEKNEITLPWEGWRLEELLGKGAYGEVYRISRELYGTASSSAVKIIHIPADKSEIDELKGNGWEESSIRNYFEKMVTELVNEAEVMESLKGAPNVAVIEDYAVEEQKEELGWTLYIRMELLKNLNQYRGEHTMDVREVVKMACDICRGLEDCQKEHLVHRDIKPSNIFVSKFGDFKIGDFGIARHMEQGMSGLSRKGTVSYMAPEIYRGESYDATVDIYSLGLVIYRLLNKGALPFLPADSQEFNESDYQKALKRRFSGEEFPDPVGGDTALGDILRKACHINPEQRFQSPSDFREALLEWSRSSSDEVKEKEVAAPAEGMEEAEYETVRQPHLEQDEDAQEEETVQQPSPEKEHKEVDLSEEGDAEEKKEEQSSGNKKKKVWAIAAAAAVVVLICIGILVVRKAAGQQGENSGQEETAAQEDSQVQDMPSLENIDVEKCVTLPEYKGITVEKTVTPVTDEDVDTTITYNLSYYPMELTDENAKVEEGDTVNIDYTGTLDGEEFEGGSATDTDLMIGSGQFIDGFESGLVGHMKGDTVELNLTFPEDYTEDLAGKDVVFTVTINAIKRPLTEITEEWVQANSDCTTIEEYRESVRKDLEEYNNNLAEENLQTQAWQQVVESATINEYPEELMEYGRSVFEQQVTANAEAGGQTLEEYMEAQGVTQEEYDEQKEMYGENIVAQMLVMKAIADAENFTEEDEEYQEILDAYLSQYGMEEDEFYEQNGRQNVYQSIMLQRVCQLIMEEANVQEVEAES
ncbi:MAG: trigger factor [Ruminococcus sp.]|jgi:trigger factor